MAEISQQLAALKANAKGMWMAGDYAKWSITLAPGAQAFVGFRNAGKSTNPMS